MQSSDAMIGMAVMATLTRSLWYNIVHSAASLPQRSYKYAWPEVFCALFAALAVFQPRPTRNLFQQIVLLLNPGFVYCWFAFRNDLALRKHDRRPTFVAQRFFL